MNLGDFKGTIFYVGKRGPWVLDKILAVPGVNGVDFCSSPVKDFFNSIIGVFGISGVLTIFNIDTSIPVKGL